MTKGVKDLRQLQVCFQADCATPGVVVARMVGTCGLELDNGRVLLEEATGLMSKHIVNRFYDPYTAASGPMSTGTEGATFQQIIWWLSMGTVGAVVPVGPAPAGVYTWTFAPALTTADVPDVAHIIYGDNAAQWETTCAIGTETKIGFAFKDAWKIDMNVVGQDWDNTAVGFETIAYPTPLDTILGQMTTFALDATCLFGTTPTVRECSLIDGALTIPGFHPKYFADGTLYYNCYGLASRALGFEWTMEFEDTLAKLIVWEAWKTGTPVYVQLVATGPLIPTTAVNYSVTANLNLVITDATTLDERDGNDTIKFTAETVYDVDCAANLEWEIIVVNGEATLPACGI